MRVRAFELINEKGEEFSLMDINNYCLFKEPSDLGYGYTSNFERMGNSFIEYLRVLNQGKISGNLEFKNYDNYKKFVDYIEASDELKWVCTIPYTEKRRTFYKNVTFQEVGKNDIFTEEDKLVVPVTFNCLSLWYEESNFEYNINTEENSILWDFIWIGYFNDTSSTSIQYLNKGHCEAPITFEIDGPVTNPKMELYVENRLYQTLKLNCNIQNYEKLFYNSKENEFGIYKIKTDGSKENLFTKNVININNDNVIRIPKNVSCELKLIIEGVIAGAKLTIFPQYKAV